MKRGLEWLPKTTSPSFLLVPLDKTCCSSWRLNARMLPKFEVGPLQWLHIRLVGSEVSRDGTKEANADKAELAETVT